MLAPAACRPATRVRGLHPNCKCGGTSMRVSGTPTYNTRYKELSDESISREHSGSTYGTLRRWAEILGLAEDAIVLESIEAEEANADELLSEIAERVNYQAAA